MLSYDLLDRSISPRSSFKQRFTQHLISALQEASRVRFEGGSSLTSHASASHDVGSSASNQNASGAAPAVAHASGVNALEIDRFEGRYLVSGGSDGSISMWDLEKFDLVANTSSSTTLYAPIGNVSRSSNKSTYGITALSFYPFDSLAFLASSYDHHLRVYASETLQQSAAFSLSSVVYSHAISPIASHLLVACATQHPAVRLVDLRSGASTQALSGHRGGAVFSVAWSPRNEAILASAGADGTVRVWDVRKSASSLGVLDMDDSIGIAGDDGSGRGARRRERGKAHNGPVNGLNWTEDGGFLVTAGHDERMRVWDMRTGANTLASFGPILRNKNLSAQVPILAPKSLHLPSNDILCYPNEQEILIYELFEGHLIGRLRPEALTRADASRRRGRVTAVAWRPHSLELLSSHSDGVISSWQPYTTTDQFVDQQEVSRDADELSESRKRKRQVLEDIYRDLTQPKVTYT